MILQIDIADMLVKKAFKHLALAKKCVSGKNKNELFEVQHCIQAIILFQSAMEAVITEEIENEPRLSIVKQENDILARKYRSLSFKNRWERAYDVMNISNRKPLKTYLTFYSSFRIPLTHPRSRYVGVEKFSYSVVASGIKNGREAMKLLFKYLGKLT